MTAQLVARLLLVMGCTVMGLPVAGCSAPSSPQPRTYVALGASDAVGIGTPDPARDGWVPRFGASLGPDTRVVNLGVSGSTLHQALAEQLGPALDAHPDVVTVWLAVNDLNAGVPLESYAQDLDRLLAALEPTHARILVANVPDLSALAPYAGVPADQLTAEVDRWNVVIAATTARHGAELVDLHARWQEVADHPEYLSSDGFHPSPEGYQRLAAVFSETYASGG
jgi:lysophospholipase L1-like esterase